MANGGALPFEAARTFARTLKLGSVKEWQEYSKSGKRPSNIPSAPDKMYRDAGWVSYPNWLGYEGQKKLVIKKRKKGVAVAVDNQKYTKKGAGEKEGHGLRRR